MTPLIGQLGQRVVGHMHTYLSPPQAMVGGDGLFTSRLWFAAGRHPYQGACIGDRAWPKCVVASVSSQVYDAVAARTEEQCDR